MSVGVSVWERECVGERVCGRESECVGERVCVGESECGRESVWENE